MVCARRCVIVVAALAALLVLAAGVFLLTDDDRAAASGPEPLLPEPLPPVESLDDEELAALVDEMWRIFGERCRDGRLEYREHLAGGPARAPQRTDYPTFQRLDYATFRVGITEEEDAWLLEAARRAGEEQELAIPVLLPALLMMEESRHAPEDILELAAKGLEWSLATRNGMAASRFAIPLARLGTPEARAMLWQAGTVDFYDPPVLQLEGGGHAVEDLELTAHSAYWLTRRTATFTLTFGDPAWTGPMYEALLAEYDHVEGEARSHLSDTRRFMDRVLEAGAVPLGPAAHYRVPSRHVPASPEEIEARMTRQRPEPREPEPWELRADFNRQRSYAPDWGAMGDEGRLSEAQWARINGVRASGLTLEERIAILDDILADGAMPEEAHEWAEIHRLSIMRGLMTDIRPFVEEAWAWLNENPEHPVAITMAATLLGRLAGAPEWGLSIPFAERGPYVEAVLDWLYEQHGYFHYHTLRIVSDAGARALQRTGAEGLEHARNERMFIRVTLQDYLDSPELQEAHGDMLPPERAAALLERVEERLARMPGG